MVMRDHAGNPLASNRAVANGVRLHYRTGGSGPALVLLHGVPKTSYHWRLLVPLLTDRYTVVMPDLRGLGDSDHPAAGYDTVTMSEDIAQLMAGLGHDTYSVIGEDWGAAIGVQLAHRHRDRVRSLVFAEGALAGYGFEQRSFLTKENAENVFLWHLGFYFQPDVPEMLIAGHERELITYTIKSERKFPDSATPDAIEEYVRCYSMPGAIRSMLSIYRAILVDAELNRDVVDHPLEMPVLALSGSAFVGNHIGPIAEGFARNVRVRVLDAGHDLAEEAPDEMASAIRSFLSDIDAAN